MENLTAASRKELLDQIAALERVAKQIDVVWQADDGEWFTRSHANEAAAREFERKLDKGGNAHQRAN